MFRLLIFTALITLYVTAIGQVTNITSRTELPDSVFIHMRDYKAILIGEIHGNS